MNPRRGIAYPDLGDEGKPPIKSAVSAETKVPGEGGVEGRSCCA